MKHATPEATKNYADTCWKQNPKISPDSWRMVEGLTVGKIGFSTASFLGHETHISALKSALKAGINLVNLPFKGQAELVDILKECPREELVLVAQVKGGEDIRGQLEAYADIEADFAMLHPRAADYPAIEANFRVLETLAKEGKIQFYGVTSPAFCLPENHSEYLSLSKVFEAAQAASATAWGRKKRPLFRAISFPFNMLQVDALRLVNNRAKSLHPKWEEGGEPVPLLELASRMHLSVFAQSPLDSFAGGQFFRLTEGRLGDIDLRGILKELKQAEQNLNTELKGWPSVGGQPVFNFNMHGRELWNQLQSRASAVKVVEEVLKPTLGLVATAVPPSAEFKIYEKVMKKTVHTILSYAENCDAARNEPLKQALQERLPDDWKHQPLQQVALNIAASTPGITSALCGLRQPKYIRDVTAIYEKGDFNDAAQILGGEG